MNKKALSICIIITLAFSFLLASCGGQAAPSVESPSPVVTDAQPSSDKDKADEIEYPVLNNAVYYSSVGERFKSYDTQEELTQASANIVTGKCISSNSLFREHGFSYTISDFLVEKCYKGDIEPGSTIKLVEFGGTYSADEYIEASGIKEKDFYEETSSTDENLTVVCGIDGYYPLNEGEEALLFLSTPGAYADIENVYGIMGSSDGKLYKINSTTYSRPKPQESNGGLSKGYSLQAALNNTDLTITVSSLENIK